MKYLMVDISGKVPLYDKALCEALSQELEKNGDSLELLSANIRPSLLKCKSRRLISLIPSKLQNSEHVVKRGIKAFEGVLNYLYLITYLFCHRCDVVHFQWLPFLEISSIEKIFLSFIRCAFKNVKLFLTIHNVYPHNSSALHRQNYEKRFAKIECYINEFIVHLEDTKTVFCQNFNIDESRVTVIPHGIFPIEGIHLNEKIRNDDFKLLMFGNQSHYKGTDILVDAISLLPEHIRAKTHLLIIGQIDRNFLTVIESKSKKINIAIVPHYVSDYELYQAIDSSDALVFPYREISQSGALLLALNFNRPILLSDLSTFMETMDGFAPEMFFTSGDAASLSNLIRLHFENPLFSKAQRPVLEKLKQKYSWQKIAVKYIELMGSLK